jgi:hypothetical protein
MADALSKQDFLAHANALHRHADDLINESGYGDDDDDEDMDEDDCRSAADKALDEYKRRLEKAYKGDANSVPPGWMAHIAANAPLVGSCAPQAVTARVPTKGIGYGTLCPFDRYIACWQPVSGWQGHRCVRENPKSVNVRLAVEPALSKSGARHFQGDNNCPAARDAEGQG